MIKCPYCEKEIPFDILDAEMLEELRQNDPQPEAGAKTEAVKTTEATDVQPEADAAGAQAEAVPLPTASEAAGMDPAALQEAYAAQSEQLSDLEKRFARLQKEHEELNLYMSRRVLQAQALNDQITSLKGELADARRRGNHMAEENMKLHQELDALRPEPEPDPRAKKEEEPPKPAGPNQKASDSYKDGDYAEALQWFLVSAEAGDAAAQFSLGMCYETGRGVEKNPEEAMKWYELAAKQGDTTARSRLKALQSAQHSSVSAEPEPAKKKHHGIGILSLFDK